MIVRYSSSTDTSYVQEGRGYIYSSCSWGPWDTLKSSTYVSALEYAMGTDTPNYHRRKNNGELLPFTRYFKASATADPCSWDYSIFDSNETRCGSQTEIYQVRNAMFQPFAIESIGLTSIPPELQADGPRMVQAAAAKIYGSGWDALTFIVELKSLVKMLTRILRRWAEYFQSRRFDDLWLEGRYGWRPLIYDVRDVYDLITSITSERERFAERQGFSLFQSLSTTSDFTWSPDTMRTTITIEKDISIRGSVVMDIRPPQIRMNPFVTAWEVIPFSFVIDWFIDITTWLMAISANVLSTRHTAGMSAKIRTFGNTDDVSFISSTVSGRSRAFTPKTSQSCVHTLTTRFPTSIAHFPSFSLNLDVLKIFDLLALILQRVKR